MGKKKTTKKVRVMGVPIEVNKTTWNYVKVVGAASTLAYAIKRLLEDKSNE